MQVIRFPIYKFEIFQAKTFMNHTFKLRNNNALFDIWPQKRLNFKSFLKMKSVSYAAF